MVKLVVGIILCVAAAIIAVGITRSFVSYGEAGGGWFLVVLVGVIEAVVGVWLIRSGLRDRR